MNDRDFLRSLGFVVGERGRFSKEMVAALASRNSKTETSTKFDKIDEAGLPEKLKRTPVREAEQLYGYDKYGHKIAFVLCNSCNQHMIWCTCKAGILAPSHIIRSENPLVTVRAA